LSLSKECKWWTEDICNLRNLVYESNFLKEYKEELKEKLDEFYDIIAEVDCFTFTRRSK